MAEIALGEGAREQEPGYSALDAMNVQKDNVFDDLMETRLEAAVFWRHRLNPVKICHEVEMVDV